MDKNGTPLLRKDTNMKVIKIEDKDDFRELSLIIDQVNPWLFVLFSYFYRLICFSRRFDLLCLYKRNSLYIR